MENRIMELTAEIENLKEELHAERKLNEVYKQGKQVGKEIDALIKGLKDSGLEDSLINEIVKAGLMQGMNNGGRLI